MTFFFDFCLSWRYVEMLRLMGVDARAHRDDFSTTAEDPDWIPVIAARRWVMVTEDGRIARTTRNRLTLLAHGPRGIFIAADVSNLGMWRKASWLFRVWPSVQAAVAESAAGEYVRVYKSGRIEVFRID